MAESGDTIRPGDLLARVGDKNAAEDIGEPDKDREARRKLFRIPKLLLGHAREARIKFEELTEGISEDTQSEVRDELNAQLDFLVQGSLESFAKDGTFANADISLIQLKNTPQAIEALQHAFVQPDSAEQFEPNDPSDILNQHLKKWIRPTKIPGLFWKKILVTGNEPGYKLVGKNKVNPALLSFISQYSDPEEEGGEDQDILDDKAIRKQLIDIPLGKLRNTRKAREELEISLSKFRKPEIKRKKRIDLQNALYELVFDEMDEIEDRGTFADARLNINSKDRDVMGAIRDGFVAFSYRGKAALSVGEKRTLSTSIPDVSWHESLSDLTSAPSYALVGKNHMISQPSPVQ